MQRLTLKVLFLIAICVQAFAKTPDWSENFPIPAGGRFNPYELGNEDFLQSQKQGKIHTLQYPVTVTGILAPYYPVKNFIEEQTQDPFRLIMQTLFHSFTKVKSFKQLMQWIGMPEYPAPQDTGVFSVPYPKDKKPDYPMGFTLMQRNGATGFTISCAECHSSRLFGKTVWGLTNRFPRANETFLNAKKAAPYLNPHLFQIMNRASDAETILVKDLKSNLKSVAARKPLVLGLDTSLAQVALSLSLRNQDEYATRSKKFQKNPRADFLDNFAADSKPAVWWNIKYKNKFLSDGSVISGNPVFTNFLWNEIGRGADLKQLETWLAENQQIVMELTTAVFSAEAPRYTDYFSESQIHLGKAQAGEILFNSACARCHGRYLKAWNEPGSENFSGKDLLRTTQVLYPKSTKVIDVGTDPSRWMGMKSLEKLNDLQISKANGTVVKAQKGYVPPPLVGVWARWPYFHNNSAPNLCAVLTRTEKRPKAYFAGAANDPTTDFDAACNGYPTGERVPKSWRKKVYYYDTTKQGLANSGHDERIFLKDGVEIFTGEQKLELIEFLKTL